MSFRLRLMISISVLIAIAFGLGGTALISASFHTSLEEETSAALNSFVSMQKTLCLVSSLDREADYEGLPELLSQMPEAAKPCALSLTAGADTLYSREEALLPQLPTPSPGQYAYTRVADSNGYGLVALSVLSAGDTSLLLSARYDLTAVYLARETQQRLYLTIYVGVVALGILVSALLSVLLTGKLKKLTTAVGKISGGDLSTRSGLSSKDEFGRLSRDFDAMADRLQENIRCLEEEVQRREAFMGAFAHEVKTPMTSIIGYADLLRQDGLEESSRLLAANYIFSEGQRLEKLSFQLLDLLLLRKEAPSFRQVSLSGFLQEIERLLAPNLAKKGISLTCTAPPESACLEPDLVKSLLYNLVDNGAKAMDGPGTVTVTGQALPGGCRFSVSDTGRGMEAAELSKITDAFYRVDKARSRSQGGAGLGLALCREIVKLHRGTMEFESSPGAGTTVTVTLYGGTEDA